ncbi:MAG: hypothetical protein HY013_20735 [Candidatus Solibacter usitatus]|nr:hypothetical protein [Candidatus Solibacter usitatus]
MDIERTLVAVVNNQAQFDARLAGLQGLVGRIAEQQLRFVKDTGAFKQEITTVTLALARKQDAFEDEMRRIAEVQREGDERLNMLITIVDGLVRREKQ